MDCRLGLYEKAIPNEIPWPQKLEAAKRAGFDFLEISIDESDFRLSRLEYSKNERQEILQASREANMYIDTMCLSGHKKYSLGSSIPDTEKRSLEIMEKAILLAYDIGARIIQLAGYDVFYEKSTVATKERFLQNLYKSSKLAAEYGIILALETMENDFCNTVEKAMYFVNSINSPYLKVYPDIGNITNATENVTYDIRLGRGNIVAAHLKETVPGIFRDMKFGTGAVDFKTITTVLKEIDIKRYTCEFWYDGNEDWENQLQIANNFLRQFIN
jgi:L-ribulose-5-phosphate 3-epimerase